MFVTPFHLLPQRWNDGHYDKRQSRYADLVFRLTIMERRENRSSASLTIEQVILMFRRNLVESV